MPPQVENLSDVLARLNPAYSAQEDIIKQQQAGLGAKYGAQKAGLEGARVKGFNTINTQANARGMAFSGIPLDEQANYLAEKYLPGMQQLTQQQNEEDISLRGQLADIGKQKYTQAFDTIQKQQSDLNSWNQMQAQLAATAEQNRLDREFKASQAAIDRSTPTSTSSNYFTRGTNTGGTNFYDPNGNPITAAQYVSALGGSSTDLISMLANDQDPTTKKAIEYYKKNGPSAAAAKYPYIFAGV